MKNVLIPPLSPPASYPHVSCPASRPVEVQLGFLFLPFASVLCNDLSSELEQPGEEERFPIRARIIALTLPAPFSQQILGTYCMLSTVAHSM